MSVCLYCIVLSYNIFYYIIASCCSGLTRTWCRPSRRLWRSLPRPRRCAIISILLLIIISSTYYYYDYYSVIFRYKHLLLLLIMMIMIMTIIITLLLFSSLILWLQHGTLSRHAMLYTIPLPCWINTTMLLSLCIYCGANKHITSKPCNHAFVTDIPSAQGLVQGACESP